MPFSSACSLRCFLPLWLLLLLLLLLSPRRCDDSSSPSSAVAVVVVDDNKPRAIHIQALEIFIVSFYKAKSLILCDFWKSVVVVKSGSAVNKGQLVDFYVYFKRHDSLGKTAGEVFVEKCETKDYLHLYKQGWNRHPCRNRVSLDTIRWGGWFSGYSDRSISTNRLRDKRTQDSPVSRIQPTTRMADDVQ